ncbi:MAG: choice-of-anchor J domain-containing protein [Anaerolineales bacterium]|nr:choice-of-anchor J domain-containing protein [Anaerolineales bacterium]
MRPHLRSPRLLIFVVLAMLAVIASQAGASGVEGTKNTTGTLHVLSPSGCHNNIGRYVDVAGGKSCLRGVVPPTIEITPSVVTGALAANSIFTTTLTVGNTGDDALEWTITEEAGSPPPGPVVKVPESSPGIRAGIQDDTPPIETEPIGAFTEGFEDITNLPGWAFQNNSEPPGVDSWFQGLTSAFSAQAGSPTSYAGVNFNSAGGSGTISNWMMTPVFSLENGESFSFWTRTVTSPVFPDRLQVRLSTSGASTDVGSGATDVGDFTTLLLDINPTLTTGGYPDTWTQYTINLTGMSPGAEGRIAFRYFVTDGGPTGGNSDYIGIDSVSSTLTALNVACDSGADISWLNVNPNAGSTPGTNSTQVSVGFDSTGFSTGTYTGTLCVESNDPVTPRVKVPVTMTVAAPSYGVALAGNQSLVGTVGQTVTHTVAVTNTGNTIDTFDFSLSGDDWTASLPSTSITLNLGGTGYVSVTVAVPPNASEGDMDTVTLTAASQGDSGQTDSTELTTVAIWYKSYLPIVTNN